MKKEFDVNGTKVIVENGMINIGNQKFSDYAITELKNAPKSIIDQCKQSGIDFNTRVYFGGAVLPREIAEEALLQKSEIQAEGQRLLDLNVPGLETLNNALEDARRYHREFNKMMDDEYNDGVNPPAHPTSDIDALKLQYPRAAAYIKAEAWESASHYVKSAAGKKAKEAIKNGAGLEETMKSMEAEWSKHCEEHMFD